MPSISARSASTLQAYDLPAPLLANTTLLAFSSSRLKGSKMTSELLWTLTPYRMPLSIDTWLDVKGIIVAALVVSRLRQRPRWSWAVGRQERNPGSISYRAGRHEARIPPSAASTRRPRSSRPAAVGARRQGDTLAGETPSAPPSGAA